MVTIGRSKGHSNIVLGVAVSADDERFIICDFKCIPNDGARLQDSNQPGQSAVVVDDPLPDRLREIKGDRHLYYRVNYSQL